MQNRLMILLSCSDDEGTSCSLFELHSFSKNIARIAKAALHKLPGKSSLNVSFVCPVMNLSVTKVGPVCLSILPVLSSGISLQSCQISPQMTCLISLNGRIFKEVGGFTQASRRLSDLVEPQICLCKEVGVYLTRCARITASITLKV